MVKTAVSVIWGAKAHGNAVSGDHITCLKVILRVEMSRHFENTLSDDYQLSGLVNSEGQINENFKVRVREVRDWLLANLNDKIGTTDPKDVSVYSGRGGIAHLYLTLSMKCANEEYLSLAQDQMRICMRGLSGRRISFLCGDPGILALASVVSRRLGNPSQSQELVAELMKWAKRVKRDTFPNELLYGRVGYLYSILFVKKHLGNEGIDDKELREIVEQILKEGVSYAKRVKSPFPMMYEWHDKQYYGAAHGLSGILYVLMLMKELIPKESLEGLVRPSVDVLAAQMFPSGNFPSSFGNYSDRLVQFCHGSPGVIFTFIKASEIFPQHADKYLEISRRCADSIWGRGILRKGYGLCHGASGNAYGLLALYQATKDVKYLHRGLQFANWVCDYGNHGCEFPDQPYCLMNGIAGTILFLSDVLDGEYIFPCFGI